MNADNEITIETTTAPELLAELARCVEYLISSGETELANMPELKTLTDAYYAGREITDAELASAAAALASGVERHRETWESYEDAISDHEKVITAMRRAGARGLTDFVASLYPDGPPAYVTIYANKPAGDSDSVDTLMRILAVRLDELAKLGVDQ